MQIYQLLAYVTRVTRTLKCCNFRLTQCTLTRQKLLQYISGWPEPHSSPYFRVKGNFQY